MMERKRRSFVALHRLAAEMRDTYHRCALQTFFAAGQIAHPPRRRPLPCICDPSTPICHAEVAGLIVLASSAVNRTG